MSFKSSASQVCASAIENVITKLDGVTTVTVPNSVSIVAIATHRT